MLKNKKATLTNDEMIGFIIGTAVFIILVILFRGLIFSFLGSNNLEESSDAYFETFVKELSKADEGNIGEFIMYKRLADEGKLDVFLIYFGNRFAYEIGDRKFISTNNKNSICVCFWDGSDAVCKRENCMDLSKPVNFDGDYGQWAISTGDQINITKADVEYIFGRMSGIEEDGTEGSIVYYGPTRLRDISTGDFLEYRDGTKYRVSSSEILGSDKRIVLEPCDFSLSSEELYKSLDSELIDYGYEVLDDSVTCTPNS